MLEHKYMNYETQYD